MLIGVDLNSRSVAMCLIPLTHEGPTTHRKHTVKVPKAGMDRAAILGELFAFMREVVIEGDTVYVEAPVLAGARNIQSTIKVASAYGAVLAAINMSHARAVEVPISSWKSAKVGHGNASKSDVSQWLHTTHPSLHRECAGDQDLIDATCIALYGHDIERSSDAGARERRLHDQAAG